MTTPADPQLIRAGLLGFHTAVERFEKVASSADANDEGLSTLTSAMECLYWACTLAEHLDKADPTYRSSSDAPGRRLVQGVRWARNHATHQLAFVVKHASGRHYPMTYPIQYFEIVWRPAADMPPPVQEFAGQRKAYDELLAGKPARHTLKAVAAFFASEQNRVGSLLNSTMGP